ncbi:MAG: N-acetylmuramoyl-L-alanine amidase [Proteobacteria bacterium]|nr:N-acetylmuramoyl-L-alanine amidase [Pseudomonadota bacterium]
MLRQVRPFLFVFIYLFTASSFAADIREIRNYQAPDHVRVVLDLSSRIEYRLFMLSSPERLVVDIDRARLRANVPDTFDAGSPIGKLRIGNKGDGTRVVFDLKRKVRPKTFLLPPSGQYGHRLVLDLYDSEQQSVSRQPAVKTRPAHTKGKADWVVAIDAGHGGEDPGAIGKRYRTREKTVVLAIAKELYRQVNATKGMRAIMTRKSDYYVGLRKRSILAKDGAADVFISIHADAVPGKRARGASVYAISERGASDTISKYLANSENAADIAGGIVGAEVKDRTVRHVLYDLSMSKNIGWSLDFGKDVLKEVGKVSTLHRRTVGQAGFAVLKSAGTPSILVETAFISNPAEEKKLRSRSFQRKMAAGLLKGIKRFFARNYFPPRAATHYVRNKSKSSGRKEYVVRRGDSLTSIARKYNIHIESLRFANNLSGSQLPVGRRLLIP